MSKDKVEAILN